MTQELIFEPGPPRFKGCPPICERTNLPSFETEKDRSDFIKMNCSQVTLQWFCSHCKRYHFWSRSSPPDSLLRVLQLRHTIPESRSRPLAKKRAKAHTTNRSQRFYADKEQEENDGAKGEYAFSDATGYPVDENPYLHGDGHIDFTVNFREKMVTVDVKAARKPVYLFVKEKDIDVCSTVTVSVHAIRTPRPRHEL